jgi:hypothetical protein
MLGYAARNWTIDFAGEWWDQWRRSTDGYFIGERISSGQLEFS